jgi:hypothetical protein
VFRWRRGGVDVEAVYVGVEKPLGLFAQAAVHAIKAGLKVKRAQKLLVNEQDVSGDFARRAQRQVGKAGFVHGGDPLVRTQRIGELAEVAV